MTAVLSTTASIAGSAIRMARQCGGAVLWGAFIAAAPLEILLCGAIVWLPLLFWRERERARRYGFWPGFVLRVAIVWSIIAAAIKVPKHDDVAVGPVSYQKITLCELCLNLSREHEVRVNALDDAAFEERLSFSTTYPMPRRTIVAALAKATGREVSFAGCGNGASFLTGKYGTYYLYPKQTKGDEALSVEDEVSDP